MTYFLQFSHAMRPIDKTGVGSFWLLPTTR
jgi:hypothetical protein